MQGVTDKLGITAGVNSLRGLTAWYHCGRVLNVCFTLLCITADVNSLHDSLRGIFAGVSSMCGTTALYHCGRELAALSLCVVSLRA